MTSTLYSHRPTCGSAAGPLRPAGAVPLVVAFLVLACLFLACGDPPVDDFRSEGGAAPDPAAVLEGTVLYQGPRPRCEGERVRGRFVLTLFRADDPPPPEGGATSALNLLSVGADSLFGLADCAAEDGPPGEIVTRSVEFVWPEIPLGASGPLAYQIRAFYDHDEDFNPFFSAANLPTAGDVIGGALEDPRASPPRFRRITVPAAGDAPLGHRVRGVTVTVALPVDTERPIFRMETEPLSAEATIPASPDPLAVEQGIADATSTRLRLYTAGDGGALARALEEGGLSLQLSDTLRYAWYIRALDADGDGMPDPHPVLGGLGFVWQTPALVLQRVRSELEREAGVPSVTFFGALRPSEVGARRVVTPEVSALVPPIAVVQTAPGPRCRIPYVPPGNVASLYEQATSDCQELPTGRYAATVLHGVAGATPVGGESCDAFEACGEQARCDAGVCVVDATRSDTGFDLRGGVYSGQAWTLPNELGDASQIDSPIAEQGPASLFVIYDPEPTGPVGRGDGRAGCGRALDPATMAPRDIAYGDFAEHADTAAVREECCAPIAHLCGVSLCESAPVDPSSPEGLQLRGGPARVDDGVPDCIPFAMPAACCG